MRKAFNISRQYFFLPFDLSCHSGKVHLLHCLIPTLLME